MNVLSALKTLPVIGILTLGLTISPGYVLADNGDQRGHNIKHSQDKGKSYNKSRRNDHHGHDRRSHKNKRKAHKQKHYSRHNSHKHHRHDHHSYRRSHGQAHSGHSHSRYIIDDHDYRDHYVHLDNLRFMIGLHTDRFDIVLRD